MKIVKHIVRDSCDSRGCLEQATDYLACGVPVDYVFSGLGWNPLG